MSSRTNDSLSSKKPLGTLDNIWGVLWHKCFLLRYLTVAQVTNPRVEPCSYETIPEERARILHFNSLFVYTHTHTHITFSLNLFFFPYLSSYPFCPTPLSYAFVSVFMLLCFFYISFTFFPLPSLSLLSSVCLAPSPAMLVLAAVRCSVGIHACAEQHDWLPAGKA